jgi:GR25 family glycosyltransferase involved in LPS biosynthesis
MIIFIIIIILALFLILYNDNSNIIYNNDFNLEKLELYLINLENRKEKFDITNNLLNNYGFNNVIRFPAVNGKNISKEELLKIIEPSSMKSILDNYRKEHHELSYGAVGCYLSHVNLWKKLQFDNLDYIIIFEDDAIPNFSFLDLQKIIKNYVPDNWDIILFGGIYNKCKYINNYIRKIYSFYETHAYIINKKGALKLLSKAFPIIKQIDSWLSELAQNNYINIYGINKNKWKQNSEFSDVQTEIK